MPPRETLQLSVNGRTYEVAASPTARLLDVLRNQLELTGTKEGCGTGHVDRAQFCSMAAP